MSGFITCDITYPFIPLVLAMGNILTNFKDRRLFSVISVIALSVPGLLRSGDFDLWSVEHRKLQPQIHMTYATFSQDLNFLNDCLFLVTSRYGIDGRT